MSTIETTPAQEAPKLSKARGRVAYWTAVFAGVFLFRAAVGFFQWGTQWWNIEHALRPRTGGFDDAGTWAWFVEHLDEMHMSLVVALAYLAAASILIAITVLVRRTRTR